MARFNPSVMEEKYGRGDSYVSPCMPPSALPTVRFFAATVAGPMLWLWNMARKGCCDDIAWVYGSSWLADIFEGVGGRIAVDGLTNLDKLDGPCVFIANHMSTLETFVLPAMIRPRMPVTFVVKRSLTTMPIFGPLMRSRNPVAVDRINPREDLAVVLRDGARRLADGISVIVFPQHTRSLYFEPEKFNSIGIKLALKVGAPVLPIALKTDAWGHGRPIKELGKINPSLTARFRFGQPLTVTGRGKEQHSQICHFIQETVETWQKTDGMNI